MEEKSRNTCNVDPVKIKNSMKAWNFMSVPTLQMSSDKWAVTNEQWQKLSEENNLKDFGRQNLGTRFAQKWMKIGLGIQQKVLIYIANTVHIFNNNFV